MAIYNVDSINEQELAAERDNIIDNMLEACDNMLTALDESKARRRTVEALEKRKERYNNNIKVYRDLGDAAYKVGHEELAKKYSKKMHENRSKLNDVEKELKIFDVNRRVDSRNPEKSVERDFKRLYDATPAKERKPGFYKDLYEKKKSIKETCLTILSVLDEI